MIDAYSAGISDVAASSGNRAGASKYDLVIQTSMAAQSMMACGSSWTCDVDSYGQLVDLQNSDGSVPMLHMMICR